MTKYKHLYRGSVVCVQCQSQGILAVVGKVKWAIGGILCIKISSSILADGLVFSEEVELQLVIDDCEYIYKYSELPKHHALICSHSLGAEIQYYDKTFLSWIDQSYPLWGRDASFRIKPDEIGEIEDKIIKLRDRLKEIKYEKN